ncbi:calcium-binding protein [Streptomyces sp. GbtcB7]|uniref:calcium-binding protein n=1 Tax=Streptomyces sp. GbtcB7 TaxID=2824752 RepID=UPI001C2FD4A8|nr:calcium-binding protein [Streptomyces sp. GbtcB7]
MDRLLFHILAAFALTSSALTPAAAATAKADGDCIQGSFTATTVTLDGGTLNIRAAAGKENKITISESGGYVRVTDDGDQVVDGLTHQPATRWPSVGTLRIAVCAGDGDDEVWNNSNLVSFGTHGESGDDFLVGNSRTERLIGGAGDDTIYAKGGGDAVYGSSGNDYLYGQNGDDRLYGEQGNDTIDGGSGDDYANGGTGYRNKCYNVEADVNCTPKRNGYPTPVFTR